MYAYAHAFGTVYEAIYSPVQYRTQDVRLYTSVHKPYAPYASIVVDQRLADRPELLDEAKALITEMRANNAERNVVVHGIGNNVDAAASEGGLSFRFRDYQATKISRASGNGCL